MAKPLKIILASDHAGYELKIFLKEQLIKMNYLVEDLGCENSDISVDYPDYAKKLCQRMANNSENCKAILICGSGIGMSIASNRYNHIRCALCFSVKLAKLARAHNNANVLSLGARFIKSKNALAIVKAFLTTEFEGNRHEARIAKLSK